MKAATARRGALGAGKADLLRRHSLLGRFLGVGSIALLVLIAAGMFAANVLELARQHLAASEDIRALETASDHLQRDAVRYREHAPRDYPAYWRDTTLYYRQLREDLAAIGDAVKRIDQRAARSSTWSGSLLAGSRVERVRRTERRLEASWSAFAGRLEDRLGTDPQQPRLEWGAIFIVDESAALRRDIEAVVAESDALVNAHLTAAAWVGAVLLPLLFASAFALLAAFTVSLYRRMGATLRGCERIALGHYGHWVPIGRRDELGALATSINALSRHIAVLLEVVRGARVARDVDEALDAARHVLAARAPIRWTGVYEEHGNSGSARRVAASPATVQSPASLLDLNPSTGAGVYDIGTLPGMQPLRSQLLAQGLSAMFALRLSGVDEGNLIMVLASDAQDAFDHDVVTMLRNIAPVIGYGIERCVLTERMLLATIDGLALLAESRDPETGNHLVRMAWYSRIIAEQLGQDCAAHGQLIDARFVERVFRFAPMHDIGKVGIADAILRKSGPLDAAELANMRQHPRIGGAVLRAYQAQLPSRHRDVFDIAIDIAEGHHEKFDGSGYPQGLQGSAIPLAARIVAAADVLDALSTRRPYKEAWSMPAALAYLQQQAGSHFDPTVVDAAMRAEARLMEARTRLAVDAAIEA